MSTFVYHGGYNDEVSDEKAQLYVNVIIDDDVKVIDEKAFTRFTNLISIEGLEHVENIGIYAFKDCKNLTFDLSSLDFRKTRKVGFGAFYNCENVYCSKGILFFPDDFLLLGDVAFNNCPKLKGCFAYYNRDSLQYSIFGEKKEEESVFDEGVIILKRKDNVTKEEMIGIFLGEFVKLIK